eukprot:767538-Hanusia_phi.AAC.1
MAQEKVLRLEQQLEEERAVRRRRRRRRGEEGDEEGSIESSLVPASPGNVVTSWDDRVKGAVKALVFEEREELQVLLLPLLLLLLLPLFLLLLVSCSPHFVSLLPSRLLTCFVTEEDRGCSQQGGSARRASRHGERGGERKQFAAGG